ncbi:hypothetical protein ABZ478_19805 [Streptomyces sp. NPDC005706]|uniref:hypothetical protein n=1 Tax=Streptomyces sp. NPDC005706 TaxID=3157169 RepID=UPI0033F23071
MTLKRCTSDGPGGFDRSWVLAADGTVRLPSDLCLVADGKNSLQTLDCVGDIATSGTVTDPGTRGPGAISLRPVTV